MNEENQRIIDKIFDNGILEILKKSIDGKPKHFEDFRDLVNHKTNKKFSPSTISLRLKQLIEMGILERTITETKTGREVVGYIITKRGIKIINLFDKCEEELNRIILTKAEKDLIS